MIKKIKSRAGLTLTELLISLLLMALFSSACLLGITTALSIRRDTIKVSDADILASTAAQVIADEIRMSSGAKPSDDSSSLDYTSFTYGESRTIMLETEETSENFGRIKVNSRYLLGSAAYGYSSDSRSTSRLHIEDLSFESVKDGKAIRVTFIVCDEGGNELSNADFTVAPINPAS